MAELIIKEFVECCFDQSVYLKPENREFETELYWGITSDIFKSENSDLFISDKERVRADKIKVDEARDTFIACHGSLRMILAAKLGKQPSEIEFYYDRYGKPWLKDDNLYFNLSHTQNAFAFVISKQYCPGVDIEYIRQRVDIKAITKMFFSENEKLNLLKEDKALDERFFLLWTRKEAFLKALGTGIIDDLSGIDVSQRVNLIDKDIFINKATGVVHGGYFIWSAQYDDYIITVAVPGKTRIKAERIN